MSGAPAEHVRPVAPGEAHHHVLRAAGQGGDVGERAGAETVREVEPLGYVGKGRDWYLIGWCRLRDGVRAFRGDRIATVEATAERPPRRPLRVEDLGIAYGGLRTLSLGQDSD